MPALSQRPSQPARQAWMDEDEEAMRRFLSEAEQSLAGISHAFGNPYERCPCKFLSIARAFGDFCNRHHITQHSEGFIAVTAPGPFFEAFIPAQSLDADEDGQLLSKSMDYKSRITLEPGKRSGKPCIRGMRITVQDVLSYLAAGMTQEERFLPISLTWKKRIFSRVWRMQRTTPPAARSIYQQPGLEKGREDARRHHPRSEEMTGRPLHPA